MQFKINIPETEIHKHVSVKDTIGADILADLVCAKNELENLKRVVPLKIDNDRLRRLISNVAHGDLTPNRKIEFIKHLRESIPGLELVAAKVLVEALQANLSNNYYRLENGYPQGKV